MFARFQQFIVALGSCSAAAWFCALYAFWLGSLAYPGLFYTDSVVRWHHAVLVSNYWFDLKSEMTDQHPFAPIFLMALFMKISGETGLFAFAQIASLAGSLFYFSRSFTDDKQLRAAINVFCAVTLVLPPIRTFAAFISNDTLFAIASLAFSALVLRRSAHMLWAGPLIVAFAVGTRINAALLLPIYLALIYAIVRRRTSMAPALISTAVALLLSAGLLSVPSIVGVPKTASWAIGTAWEYVGLASKTGDDEDRAILAEFGLSPSSVSTCYRGMYCGSEGGVALSMSREQASRIVARYLLIAVEHPLLFVKEKAKYIGDLLGLPLQPLLQSEIGVWSDPYWAEAMAPYGFHPSLSKGWLVASYYQSFESALGGLILVPWMVIALCGAASCYLACQMRTWSAAGALFLPILYYCTFAAVAQNHEVRYFFPVIFGLCGVLCAAVPLVAYGAWRRLRTRYFQKYQR